MVKRHREWGGARRFYARAEAVEVPEGWTVALDGRPLRAPSGALLASGRAIAGAIAAEWAAQPETIDPTAMPATRALNTAIDRIRPQRDAVVAEIAGYAATDLVCYRAEGPAALAAAEAAAWDPLIAWARDALGAALSPVTGVMHAPQPKAALAAAARAVGEETDLGLAALHELTTLAGSVVIGLAVRRGRLAAEDGWRVSRIDEEHQAELWGRDEEAEATAAAKAAAFAAAARIGALADEDRRAET